MDLKSTYSVYKFCLKWKEIYISLKFNNIKNEMFNNFLNLGALKENFYRKLLSLKLKTIRLVA